MKKYVITALIVALVIVAIPFLPGLAEIIISLLVPPRRYYLIGVIIIGLLIAILNELRRRK